MDKFINVNNWVDRDYRRLDCRFPTMKAALNLYHQAEGTLIVETGCARQADDWGAGMSTILFADYCSQYGGELISIDNNPTHLAICKQMLESKELFDFVELRESCSAKALTEFDRRIDLLYLDSWDFPYGDLLNLYGGQADIEQAQKILAGMTDEEIVAKHGDVILPSQQHCLAELNAVCDRAMPVIHDKTVILIDDNNLPGGGKPRLAKERLVQLGWKCVLDFQQSLWIKW